MRERPILFSAPMIRALLAGTKTQTRRVVKPRPDWLPEVCSTRLDGPFVWPVGSLGQQCGAPLTKLPYGVPGDLLWVREAHYLTDDGDHERAVYAGDEEAARQHLAAIERLERTHPSTVWAAHKKLRPSIHMPRWASRITLRITDVRVERLQDISEADAIAEGLYKSLPDDEDREWFRAYTEEQSGTPPTAGEWETFEEGVWMVPGVPQGWGLTPAERRRDQWAPTPQFAYRLIWEHINGPGSWAANPWVWVVEFERAVPNPARDAALKQMGVA